MKQKVALVLSGGGARGIAHIGVIEEIEKCGFEISSIAGTSMGAVVGGIYAMGKLPEFKNWLFTLDKIKVFQLLDFSISSQGLLKGDKVLKNIQEFIKDKNIEDLRIPFAALASDIINNKEVVFTQGSIFKAIRASIAIPSIVIPVKTEDGLLVDGGVINNIPLNIVKRTQGDILMAVDVNANVELIKLPNSKKALLEKKKIYNNKQKDFQNQLHKINGHIDRMGFLSIIDSAFGLMRYQLVKMYLEKYPPDLLISIAHDTCGTFDFYKAEELVEIGKLSAKKILVNFKNPSSCK
ncbi:MAG: patatin-like phospholipase family protein [Salinivirgaceae bacterium]|nr:patatin-like phospholipase family protein [Salinivirgaceae bacterium]